MQEKERGGAEIVNMADAQLSNDQLLGRLDERTRTTAEGVADVGRKVDGLTSHIDKQIQRVQDHVAENYVSKEKFAPIERLVWAVVVALGTGGAVIVGLAIKAALKI